MKNKKIIMTAGSFDLFHKGHLNILEKAKSMGDILIVAVSEDELIKRYKGTKPVVCYKDREDIIRALKCVDKVITQTKLIDIKQIQELKVDLYVLGTDWKERFDNEGLNWLRNNKKVVFVPYTKRLSSSKIKERIIRNAIPIIRAQTKRTK